METWVVIIAIIIILATLSGGVYLGRYIVIQQTLVLKEQIITIKEQLELQETYSKHWANEAINKYTLFEKAVAQNKVIQEQQTGSVNETLKTVLGLLATLQRDTPITQTDEKVIDQIIQQAKNISPNGAFEV